MAQRVDILGVQFDNVTRTEAVERALTLAAGEKTLHDGDAQP